MANGDYTARFEGCAALGAWKEGEALRVYAVSDFGFDEPGRFSAMFDVFEAAPPVTDGRLGEMLADACAAYFDGLPADELYEACEEYDCAPSGLGDALARRLLEDNDGDAAAAWCDFRGGDLLPFGEGEWRVEMAGGGQADEFAKLEHLFCDAETLSEVERLWRANHLSDMHAGTPAQEEALAGAGLSGAAYDLRVKYLEEAGLLSDDWPGRPGYVYGTGWLDWGVTEADAAATARVVEALSALPGPQEAVRLYLDAHPAPHAG